MAGPVTNIKHHLENPPEKSIKSTKKGRPLNSWKQHLAKDKTMIGYIWRQLERLAQEAGPSCSKAG